VSTTTLVIALAVLAASILLLWYLVRTQRTPDGEDGWAAAASRSHPARTGHVPAGAVLEALTAMGRAMIGSGYPVGLVQDALEEIAAVNGLPGTHAVVLPTSIIVSTAERGRTKTRAVSAGGGTYTLAQIDAIDTLQTQARRGDVSAAAIPHRLTEITAADPPFGRALRIAAYPVLSASIAVLLGASWAGVLVAGLLGVGVGLLLVFAETVRPSYSALVIVGAALGVSIVGLLVARTSVDPGVLPSVVAPLVMFLPGGLLTTAVIELATGHIVSGAARAAAGAMRLVLLAAGIVAAGALVGVPEVELSAAADPLGPVAPWIAVALFGLAIGVFQSARRGAIGWILIVLYVAYGAQVIGDLFLDGVLSALVGAAAMTPVAILIARQRSGPPAIVSFLPAFWLLVPGALGLVGVTGVIDGSDSGAATLVTTAATMVAIALGVLIGLAATSSLRAAGSRKAEGAQPPSA
jgi:uncharacterized membrane protein YjjP (DUF1212 family)